MKKKDKFNSKIVFIGSVIAIILLFSIFSNSTEIFSIEKITGEAKLKPQCNDRIDNDKDGLIDYRIDNSRGIILGDPDCISNKDDSEAPILYCGDKICNANEDCTTCPIDCGVCPPPAPYCGDKNCDNSTGENCITCSFDCGVCAPFCGDGICNNNENCTTCITDCGTCPNEPTCSITFDGICPSFCSLNSDADCCINSGEYWLQTSWGYGCYNSNYSIGCYGGETCKSTDDGCCPNWCSTGTDFNCCTNASKCWIDNGCYLC